MTLHDYIGGIGYAVLSVLAVLLVFALWLEVIFRRGSRPKTVSRPHAVKVIRASMHPEFPIILWTLQLRYWRAIHAELMTHRVFSRNAGSSRAIPVMTMLKQVWSDPAGPIHWGVNQPGMQAAAELVGWRRAAAGRLWRLAGKSMCMFAWVMVKLNVHKQVANRLLEPWQYINVVVTSTEWDNFFALRCHKDAQPEFQALARHIQWVMNAHADHIETLEYGDWHLPYIQVDEETLLLKSQKELSVARCARVSYAPFDGNASLEKEFERHNSLRDADPMHASPFEHQATPMPADRFYRNLRGFMQYRVEVEDEVLMKQVDELEAGLVA